MPRREKTLFLIDGSAQLHRAYFAIRNLSTTRGLPTGATYGFTTMLRKLYQDEDPEWIGISFDLAGPTFRHEEYTDYKATRRKMDDDLRVQLPFVRRVCGVYGLPIVDSPGFEADDVIATLARQAVEQGLKVVVVSGDKDLLQMVDGDVKVLNPGRDGAGAVWYDRATVEEKFGVPPERVVDVLALVGDSVDNVPGVPGIGEKGARDLVREYGAVEAVIENADKVKKATYREGLKTHAADALMSKRLVTLRTDVPVTLDLGLLLRPAADRAAAHALFTELEFVALAREYAPEPATVGTAREVIRDEAALRAFVERARQAGRVAVSMVRSTREPMRARLAGVGLAVQAGQAVYVPVEGAHLDATDALPAARVLEALRPLMEDEGVAKLSARGKLDHILLARAGIALRGLRFDALVAAYLLHPGRRTTAVEDLSLEHLGQRPRPTGTLLEGGAEGSTLDDAADAAVQEADITLRLEETMTRRLQEEGVSEVFERTELPLVEVLAEMERAGVKVNPAFLREMGVEMEQQLEQLTREIYALAGGEFNIQSPIQLRDVLFTRLGLKSRTAKKTAKTRVPSTAEEVLEDLAESGHELPRKILEYRGVQKLKSTYVDPLPLLIHPETGRVHASFQQTIAATGRLSMTEPNLQNVPIRTPTGRRVREAFVAEPGHLLLSADYSQIELRVLAHLSRDATLIDTFVRGEDVHDRTGREIFGPFSPVPPEEQRRVSKMVNYALLYGKSAFTLAKDIGVTREQAEQFVQAYFARYPAVKRFLDDTVERARETGVVRTLLGRLRRLPDLRSPNYQMRAEAERQALNMPVQGSAADLIKKAMIDLHAALRTEGLRSRLILQIHDELLLEVPEAEAEQARALVKRVMEGALALEVPLVADAKIGSSWAEVH